MKKLIALVLSAAMVMMLVACGGNAAQPEVKADASGAVAKTVSLQIGHVLTEGNPVDLALDLMAENLAVTDNNELKVEIFPGEQLGNETTLPEGLSMGTIDCILLSSGGFARLIKEFSVIDAPYIWDDANTMRDVLKGEVGDIMKEIADKAGYHVIDIWYAGTRHITTSGTPIVHPEDLNGVKLRVPEITLYMKTMESMGASCTPIAFGELFSALQTNVVDGQENPLSQIVTAKLYEVQEYLTLDGHISQGMVLAVRNDTWQSLSAEAQAAFEEQAYAAGDWLVNYYAEMDAEYLKEIEDAGLEVIEVDMSEFRACMDPVVEYFAEDWGDLYQTIRDAQEK